MVKQQPIDFPIQSTTTGEKRSIHLISSASYADSSPSPSTPSLTTNSSHESVLNTSCSSGCPLSTTSSSSVLATLSAALVHMNAVGVACMLDEREDEALVLFQQGLSVCGVHVHTLFAQNPEIATRLKSKLATHGSFACSNKEPWNWWFLPSSVAYSCDDETGALHSIDPVEEREDHSEQRTSSETLLSDRRIPFTGFTAYERAFVFGTGEHNPQRNSQHEREVAYKHIAPVLLYNLGLLIHRRAVTAADCFLAHELYRFSLFLMEENTIHGFYNQEYDTLLMALFNNLGELNGSFYQRDQFGTFPSLCLFLF